MRVAVVRTGVREGAVVEGASVVLSPASLRVLDQFGVLDDLLAVGSELTRNVVFGADDGSAWADTQAPRVFRECHGIGQVAVNLVDEDLRRPRKMTVHALGRSHLVRNVKHLRVT